MSRISEAVLKSRREQGYPPPIPILRSRTASRPVLVSTPPWAGSPEPETSLARVNGHGSPNGAQAHILAGTQGESPTSVHGLIASAGANGHRAATVVHRPPRPEPPIPESSPRKILWKLVYGRFGAPDQHLVSLVSPGSFASEQFRRLRLAVEQLKLKQGTAVIAVSSPAPGDGKTLTALNLAGALSHGDGVKVLVVDADLRKPSVAKVLNMKLASPGLADFVSAPDRFGLIQKHPRFNLAVLPAGNAKATPHEILKSDRLVELLGSVRSVFDYVILDCPPISPVSDCLLIQDLVDGILLVVRAGRAPREMIDGSIRSLNPQKILGVVFNEDRRLSRRYEKRVLRYGGSHG